MNNFELYCRILEKWDGSPINNIETLAEIVDRELKELRPLCDELRQALDEKIICIRASGLDVELAELVREEVRYGTALLNYNIKGDFTPYCEIVTGCAWLGVEEREGSML